MVRPRFLLPTLTIMVILGLAPAHAQQAMPAQVYSYYAPEQDLQAVDTGLIAHVGAGDVINLAGYVLSDHGVINAFIAAAARGAWIRVYLDPGELKRLSLGPDHPIWQLAASANVEVRVKRSGSGLMHLKGYSISGSVLRTGSANLSMSGLRRQDNDLVLIYSPAAARRFDDHFEQMWDRSDNTRFSEFQAAN
ncbi:phospholipase D-like domain-containing protein [Labrys sp. 22185]|uniref:phospholipase D-like domain-containing protein n=1 Tax=Labrys sp. 22185 TaxID=3453888 RepID=UPI003F843EB6